jgi:hypothetical protein
VCRRKQVFAVFRNVLSDSIRDGVLVFEEHLIDVRQRFCVNVWQHTVINAVLLEQWIQSRHIVQRKERGCVFIATLVWTRNKPVCDSALDSTTC